MEENPVIIALQNRYLKVMHAVQTGISYKIQAGETEHSPKHLRVGVNSAMINNAAMVKILVEKGIFTYEDYWNKIIDEAEAEVKRYEEWIEQTTGAKVTLM